MDGLILRDGGDPPQYGDQDYFTLEIRHGGVFNQAGEYVGGIVHWVDYHDVDKFSTWEIEEAATHLGYRIDDTCFFFNHVQDGLVEGLVRGRGTSRGRGRGGMSSGSGLEPPTRQTAVDNERGRGRAVIRGRGRGSTRARGRGLQVQAKQPITTSTYESVNRGGHVVQLSQQLEGTQSSQANHSSFNEVRSRNAAHQRARPWKL